MSTSTLTTKDVHAEKMQGYYRLHAAIYDLTRWVFLFGRHWLLDLLPFDRKTKNTIVEIGCGTGYNLKYLSNTYPQAHLIGVDVSADMLEVADKKLFDAPKLVVLKQRIYGEEPIYFDKKPDCIVFSYCLTMVNPNWERLVLCAKQDLDTNGQIAVVDFHQSRFAWFRKWMGFNHVRMEGHILPFLQEHFETVRLEKRRAYLGLWHYFLYIGKLR